MPGHGLSWRKQLDQHLCGEDECGKPVEAEGRCTAHYALWHAHWRAVCPGRCNDSWRAGDTGYRAATAAYDVALEAWRADHTRPRPVKPEPPESRPWLPDPVFCGRCTASVRARILEISDMAATAEAENLGLRKGPGAERVSGSRHRCSPSATGNDLEALGRLLRDWEGTARRADTLPRRGHLAPELATYCSRLATACFPVLMATPDMAVDFAADVHEWHRRLRDSTRSGTGRHQKSRPCPRCDRYSLVWEEGDAHVACQRPDCGRLMTLDDYDLYDELFPHFREPGRAA